MAHATNGDSLSRRDRDRIKGLLDKLGEVAALEALGISRSTLGRCLGGLSIHRGTIALVSQRLDEHEKGAKR